MSKVRDELTPEGKKLMSELEKLKALEVRVGYQAGKATSDDGIDMCDIAMWNELGAEGEHPIPARPFLRQSVDNNEGDIRSFCYTQAVKVAHGGTAKDCLESVGTYMKGVVQETIRDGEFTPNAPATVRRKGSDHPLIDTGRLRQSVNFVVTQKGGR